MDIIDRASETEEMTRNIAINKARQRQSLQGTTECIDCDEPIPAARRAANPSAQRCIDCQTDFERKRRVK
ncbi:TraR/DksA C4-type zinc finger protein [Rappaport israeli]|uniref:TraR/DksA C4-type zinc finger protein n=1 Tax=Rappaport israeli TaxID=1839807 RepID=UPI0009311565|nr:TraR/DksA C4-type zinc finger protein [Rappaport israeli]